MTGLKLCYNKDFMQLDGWEALSDTEAKAIRMRQSGKSYRDIAEELGITGAELVCKKALKKLNDKIKFNAAMRGRR